MKVKPNMNIIPATDIKPSSIDFLDVSKDTQLIHNPPTVKSNEPPPSNDYIKVCERLWSEKGHTMEYQKGLFLGRGDRSNILLYEFLKKFRKTLELIIIEELKTTNNTSEGFKDDFKVLEHVFNMIINHLAVLNVEVKNEKVMAILHGFINSYIRSTLNTDNNA